MPNINIAVKPEKKPRKRTDLEPLPPRPRRRGPIGGTIMFAGFCLSIGGAASLAGAHWGSGLTLLVLVWAFLAYSWWKWRHLRWRRECESIGVFQRLSHVARLDYADRRTNWKVTGWDGSDIRSALLAYGPKFTPDKAGLKALAAEFAASVHVPVAAVTCAPHKRGVTLAVLDGDAEAPQVSTPGGEPADADDVTARITDALSGVLDVTDVEVTAWHPDGAPVAGVLNYPATAAKVARDARADLPTVLSDVSTPRSENGRWRFTWEPDRDRFVFRDEPDLLAPVVPLPPIERNLDLTRGPVIGSGEDAQPWRIPLLHNHVLVAGATGSGKGSVLWSIIRGVAPLMSDGRCLLYVSDPKGGMELGVLEPLAHRFALGSETADMLREAAEDMEQQARRLRAAGLRKLEAPTRETPLRLVLVDEIAAIASDREASAQLARLLQQGRAPGTCVIGALQDPRAKNLDVRNLFPTAVALRLKERQHVDMVLGAGARASGAAADLIPRSLPGVGYVVADGMAETMRVRAAYVPDDEIERIALGVSAWTKPPAGRAQDVPTPAAAPQADYDDTPDEDYTEPVSEPVTEAQVVTPKPRPARKVKPTNGPPVYTGDAPARYVDMPPSSPLTPGVSVDPDVKVYQGKSSAKAKGPKPLVVSRVRAGTRVVLPDETGPAVVLSVEPSDEDEDTLVVVTYVRDGDAMSQELTLERDAVVTSA